jgi:FkbM family methyltransferase
VALLFHLRKSRLLRKLWRVSVTVPVKWDGTRFTIYADLFRNIRFVVHRQWLDERDEQRTFASLIKRFGVQSFWDVGANIGFYSLIFLQNNPRGTVRAFEPDRRNLALLRKTQKRNALAMSIIDLAVGDKIGTAPFYVDDITGSTGSLVRSNFIQEQYGQAPLERMVLTTTLDEQLKTGAPDFVKIDVEGAELEVFQGAAKMLKTCQPILMFEATETTWAQTSALLKDNGYQLFSASTGQKLEDGTKSYNVLALHNRHLQQSKSTAQASN